MPKTQQLAVFSFVLILLISNFSTIEASPIVYDESHPPLIVMFDFGHDQYFNSTNGNFNMAISALNELANVTVRFTNEPLTENLLSGVDVLICTNPGKDAKFKEENGVYEISGIEKYLSRGKGLFFLSNPLSEGNETNGNPKAFNRVLDDEGIGLTPPTAFWEEDGEPDLVINEFDVIEEKDQVLYELNSTKHFILGNQTNPVNEVLASSQTIRYLQEPLISAGRASNAIDVNEMSHDEAEDPAIFGYTIYREVGRIVSCGSTLMFSDIETTYTIDNETVTTSWFEALDNAQLWINTVLWLAGIFPLSEWVEHSPAVETTILYGVMLGTGGLAFIGGTIFLVIGRNEEIKPIEEIIERPEKPKEKPVKREKRKVRKPKKRKRR